MKKAFKFVTILTLGLLIFSNLDAKSSKKKKSKTKYQRGLILRDGTAVYEAASFDAPIIDYKAKDQKVKVSRKLYKGRGGSIGLFYKVKLKGKRRGYIPDNEVIPQYKNKVSGLEAERKRSDDLYSDGSSGQQRVQLSQSRFVGLVGGQYNVAERFLGEVVSDDLIMFGGKMTGPGGVHEILPLDLEVVILPGIPEYYETSKVIQTSGFLILSSLLLLTEIIEARDTSLYYGLGLTLLFAQYQISAEETTLDSKEVRLGAAASLGVAQRLSRRIVGRLEAKYYFEKEKYLSFGASVQLTY